jgi:hypothetical protein
MGEGPSEAVSGAPGPEGCGVVGVGPGKPPETRCMKTPFRLTPLSTSLPHSYRTAIFMYETISFHKPCFAPLLPAALPRLRSRISLPVPAD